MELWFGIDDKSQESFDTGVEAQKKAFAQLLTEAKVPEAAFLTPLVGTYHSPDLGELKLSLVKGEAWVDAGAFKTRVLHHIRKDGRVALLFRDPGLGRPGADDPTRRRAAPGHRTRQVPAPEEEVASLLQRRDQTAGSASVRFDAC
jgi:hypothetical protein